MNQGVPGRLAAAGALLTVIAACGTGDEPAAHAPDPARWDEVLAAADGTTLDLHMWGGSTEINRFVDEVYAPRLAERGITPNRVPLADTFDAVDAVLGELEAGRTAGGAVEQVAALLRAPGAVASLNLVVSDGRRIVAGRTSVGMACNSLYVLADREPPWFDGVLVASEPLDDRPWQPVPPHHVVDVAPDGTRSIPLALGAGR